MNQTHKLSLDMRYVWMTLLVCALGLSLTVGFNALVDPFGMFRWVQLPSINAHRPAIYNRVRLMKAYDVRRIKPQVIVLGSSRSHLGMRMSHASWNPSLKRRYNLAFDGATTKEMYYYLRHTNAISPLKQVILGLDNYHPLPAPAITRPDFSEALLLADDSYLSKARLILQDAKLFASMQTLNESWRTLGAQSLAAVDWYGADGQRLGDVFFRRKGESFHEQGPRAYFDEINKLEVGFQLEWRIPQLKMTPVLRATPQLTSLDYVEKIVTFCRQHQIDLRIFLTPSHAHQMEITAATGAWDTLERGKRALVDLLGRDALRHPDRAPIPLWDFSGYSTVTTESIPPVGSHQEMKHYWDSSHFKQQVGDWVLDRIFNVRRPESPLPEDFGIQLTNKNIDDVITKLRDDRSGYRKSHSNEIDQLRRWVDVFVRENGIERQELVVSQR